MQPPHGHGPPGYGPPPGYGQPGYGPPGHGPPGYGPPGYGPPVYGAPGFRPPKKPGLGVAGWVGLAFLAVLGGCIGLVVLASRPDTPEEKAKREADRAEAKEAREGYVATLAKMNETVKGLDLDRLSRKPCDGAKLKAGQSKDVGGGLHVVYAPFLERFAKPSSAWSKDDSPWAWITDSGWSGFFDAPPSEGAYSSDAKTLRDYWIARRYMIVVVPSRDGSNALPKVPKSGDFESGYFEGWAVVFDQNDASIACQFPLEVTNSDKVSFRDSGAFKESPEKAILKDFQDNFEDALEKGIPSPPGLGTGYGKILK